MYGARAGVDYIGKRGNRGSPWEVMNQCSHQQAQIAKINLRLPTASKVLPVSSVVNLNHYGVRSSINLSTPLKNPK